MWLLCLAAKWRAVIKVDSRDLPSEKVRTSAEGRVMRLIRAPSCSPARILPPNEPALS